MMLTFRNVINGTTKTVIPSADGCLNRRQVIEARRTLAPPGSPGTNGAGILGELGDQLPREAPGWAYEVIPEAGGGARLVARRVAQAVSEGTAP